MGGKPWQDRIVHTEGEPGAPPVAVSRVGRDANGIRRFCEWEAPLFDLHGPELRIDCEPVNMPGPIAAAHS
jgi:hypothetical protein